MIAALQNSLAANLHGQHLVNDVVLRALKAHLSNDSPTKVFLINF